MVLMANAAVNSAPKNDSRNSRLATVRGVEIFATGHYRGKDYTFADLCEIARNFKELGPAEQNLLRPPVVLGHEEHQEYLERTDLPAAGWPSALRVRSYYDQSSGKREAILIADFSEVPESIANMINARAYRKVSAEIYDDFQDDFGRGHGKALRRVALLGGEVPQVKRLADVPIAHFTESAHSRISRLRPIESQPCRSPNRGTFFVFAEVEPMDRAAMVSQLMAAMPSLSQAVIDTMTDDQLAELVKNLPAPAPAAAAAAAPAMMADRQTMIDELVAMGQDPLALEAMDDAALQSLYDQLMGAAAPAPSAMADVGGVDMSREEMIAALVAQGQDAASLETLTDDELAAMLMGTSAAVPAAAVSAAPMADRRPKKVTMQFAERQVQATLKRIAANEKITALHADRAKRQQVKIHKQQVSVFCDQMVREGRLLPAQRPAIETMLVRLDDVNPVHRFTESGRVKTETAFERKKRELLQWPVLVRFGERPGLSSKTGSNGSAAADTAAEVQKVAKFAEVHADSLTRAGRKPEAFVATFTEMRKKNPALTAAKYGVPAEFCS